MKRVVAILLLFSLLLALCACGGTTDTENPSGDGERTSTLMTAATDLANEIDGMPLYSDVLMSISSSVKIESADLSMGENVFFYRDEHEEQLDGVYLHEDYLPDDFDPAVDENQYDGNRHTTENKSIDSTVESWKKMKDIALLSCKELDVWVQRNPSTEIPIPPGLTPTHSNYRYRIHYDVNRDFVTVEELVDERGVGNGYTCLTIGYTPEGKLKVDGFYANFGGSVINGTSSVHYLEDAYYMSVGNTPASDKSNITILNSETEQWVKIYPIFNYEDVDGVSVPKIVGMDYLLSFDRGGYLVEITKDTESIYLPDGRYGIVWEGLNNFYISLDFFDGWRQVESTDSNALLTLTTEKGAFLFHTQTHEDFDFLNREKFFFNLSYMYGTWPLIWLHRGNSMKQQGIDWSTEDAKESLAALEEILGITAKQELRDLVFSLREEHSTLENSFHFPFGEKTSCLLTVEAYTALVEELVYADVTPDSLHEAASSEIIPFDKQTPEYEYFEFLDFAVTGGASFDEATSSLDLSAITATLSPSVLLNKDATYRLVFLFVSDDGRSMVGSKTAVYTGDTLAFSGALQIQQEGIPSNDKSYTLQCYLADDGNNRISRIQTVKGERSGEYDLSTESRGQTLTVTQDKVTVANFPLPTEE